MRKVLKIAKEPISLETPDRRGARIPIFGDFIEDKTAVSPIDVAIHLDLQRTTANRYPMLTAREEQVVRMRFGIGMNTDHTLEEVGQQFSMSAASASARSRPRRCENLNT